MVAVQVVHHAQASVYASIRRPRNSAFTSAASGWLPPGTTTSSVSGCAASTNRSSGVVWAETTTVRPAVAPSAPAHLDQVLAGFQHRQNEAAVGREAERFVVAKGRGPSRGPLRWVGGRDA